MSFSEDQEEQKEIEEALREIFNTKTKLKKLRRDKAALSSAIKALQDAGCRAVDSLDGNLLFKTIKKFIEESDD